MTEDSNAEKEWSVCLVIGQHLVLAGRMWSRRKALDVTADHMDRVASPAREVHVAVSFMPPTLRVSLLCLAKQYGKHAPRLA